MQMAKRLKAVLLNELDALEKLPTEQLLEQRYTRLRSYGTNQRTRRRTRAGAMHRFPALLGESGDGAELAALRHRRLFAPDSPAMRGSL
ncbi:hypothetical protein G6F59_012720 [Rhizopus arrhizus]|nr:hypothetical protein G6F59_012720 [Rhizopus arrhizus]